MNPSPRMNVADARPSRAGQHLSPPCEGGARGGGEAGLGDHRNGGGTGTTLPNRPFKRGGNQRARASTFERQHGRRGFTLVELMAVVIIIGIILSFVFVAGMDAIRRSEERATQTLIAKLEGGLNDRLEALLETRPDYNSAHYALGTVYNSAATLNSITRAQVIAWLDYVKAEMPDTFYVQTNFDSNYPLNFAGNYYPTTVNTSNPYPYVLPLGQGDGPAVNPNVALPASGTGVYGASYTAAAGIYKNLGYTPTGYDGVDNDGDGLVDNYAEGVSHGPPWTADSNIVTKVSANLANHKHVTARAEMLYALLVEGSGPLGSVFSPDEFTTKEVQDTDGDGLPEFVDAWGQPLQFFRWPLLYHSDIQIGQVIAPTSASSWTVSPQTGGYNNGGGAPYVNVFQTREQDPLDPNQLLMAPAWWTASYNSNYPSYGTTGASYNGMTPTPSGGVMAIEYFFHRLSEPLSGAGGKYFWDRGTTYGSRRAFYSKFLVLSGGPDQTPGVFLYPESFFANVTTTSPSIALIANENNALPFSINDVNDFTSSATIPSSNMAIPYNPSSDPTQPSSSDLIQAAQDDISNQNLSAIGNIGGSG